VADLGGTPFDVVVADLSFISLRTVADPLVALARPFAPLVVLVKPQFEAGRKAADRGRGVVREESVWAEAMLGATSALEAAGATMMDAMVSPLRGADGNVEFFVHLQAGRALDAPPLTQRFPMEAVLDEARR
jgi:23S rRNA (cytidine1920-2'-O)/16S rRNA (cytidine1409-2'-O)-methyltransferase